MTRTASGRQGQPEILVRTTTASDELPSIGRYRWFSILRQGQKRVSPLRIAVFGLFGCGNCGNDGSLEAILLSLRQVRPDAKLVCICAGPDQVARDFHVTGIALGLAKPDNVLLRVLLEGPRKLASFASAFGHVRKLDVLLVCGGGALGDFGAPPYGCPLTLFAWCLAARLCGTRLAFVNVGAGPISHPISRWLLKSSASIAQYRSYRDTISKTFMDSIGFDTGQDLVCPDLVFKLSVPPSPPIGDGALTIGVGVIAHHSWSNLPRGAAVYAMYMKTITRFVIWLLDHGYRVRILTGDVVDRLAVDDLIMGVAAERASLPRYQMIAAPMYSIHDLMHQIAKTEVVVATRFHNVVCALKLGKPTLSIGYTEKNEVLMAEMGMSQFCQNINHVNIDLLIQQFTQLIADRQRYDQGIRDMNLVYRERLDHQISLLASQLF